MPNTTMSSIVYEKERSSIFRRSSLNEKEPGIRKSKIQQRSASVRSFFQKIKSTKKSSRKHNDLLKTSSSSSETVYHDMAELQIVATASQDGSETGTPPIDVTTTTTTTTTTTITTTKEEVFENCESFMTQDLIDVSSLSSSSNEKLQDYSSADVIELVQKNDDSIEDSVAEDSIEVECIEERASLDMGAIQQGQDEDEDTEESFDEEEYVEEKELEIAPVEAPDALALWMVGSLMAFQLFAH